MRRYRQLRGRRSDQHSGRHTADLQVYPDYNIPLTTVDGTKALLFDPSPQHRHQIPRLLADDYLHSYLTDRTYEAGSKQRVIKA